MKFNDPLTPEREEKLKAFFNHPLMIGTRVVLGCLVVSQMIIPALVSIGNKASQAQENKPSQERPHHWQLFVSRENCTQFIEGKQFTYDCAVRREDDGSLRSFTWQVNGVTQSAFINMDYMEQDKNIQCLTSSVGGGGSVCLGSGQYRPQGIARNTQQSQVTPSNPITNHFINRCAQRFANNSSAFAWCVREVESVWGN